MLSSQLFSLTLALAPSLVSAAIFPSDTQVKMLDAKGFKEAMKRNVSEFDSILVNVSLKPWPIASKRVWLPLSPPGVV